MNYIVTGCRDSAPEPRDAGYFAGKSDGQIAGLRRYSGPSRTNFFPMYGQFDYNAIAA
jgi:hypothetical protein